MRFVRIFTKLAALVLLIMFFIQNSTQLSQGVVFTLNFYAEKLTFTSGSIPLFFVILVAFLLGAFITGVAFTYDKFRLGRRLRQTRLELKKAEKELTGLRQLPFCEDIKEERAKLPVENPVDPQ